MKARRPDRYRFLLFSLCLILFLCILASINQVRFNVLLNFGRCAFANLPSTTNSLDTNIASNNVRILIAILTLPDQYLRRHVLRMVYHTQSLVNAQIDVKFVFCNLTKDDQMVLVALEIMRHEDIIILNCDENMNNGKTYTFFSSLPTMLNDTSMPYPPYHYVMKADDDIYFRLNNLVEVVMTLPREDLYYGFVIPCESMEPFKNHYMAGMGYMLSWDLVEWIRDSDIPKKRLVGPEDRVLGLWIKDGRRGKNRYNAKWSMYNFPGSQPTKCSHEFWPNTIAVHLLKNNDRWIQTLKYFNVTSNLKPSKLYHIP